MSFAPNATASTGDFEFAALNEARNYRKALIAEFRPWLRGDVMEIGAGIGQMTMHLRELQEIQRIISVEPDAQFCLQHRKNLADHKLIEGTADDLPPESQFDAIFSVNVLEHIGDDADELANYARLLAPRRGALCLFVPAGPEIYAPIDKDFGHFRRYTRPELRGKLAAAGFEIKRLDYFNAIGYFAWWLNFCVLKKRHFEIAKVRAYDRLVFPVAHFIESCVLRPPFGQSLLAVACAR